MTSSNIEKQYQKLMIHHISNIQVCPEFRAALFLDFHENADAYYDNLCDTLYLAAVGEITTPLWLRHNGEVYASAEQQSLRDVFLLDAGDLPAFKGDLMEHFDYAFSRIYASSCAPDLKLCAFS